MGKVIDHIVRNPVTLGYAGVIWLIFLIGHLYLMVVRLGEDQRTNTMFKRDLTTLSNFSNYSTFDREHNWKDLSIQLRNEKKNALTITITKSCENRFSIQFLLIFHRRFANT